MRGTIYNTSAYANGYVVVGYYDRRKKRRSSIGLHRLVARNFIHNPLRLPQINHKDEDKANNRVDNLEWCDGYYNQRFGTVNKRRIATRTRRGGKNGCKPITLVKNGEVRQFCSISEAALTLNLSTRHLSSLLKHKTGFRTVKGWSLIGDENYHREKPLKLQEHKTGQVVEFKSHQKAAEFLGIDVSNLMRSLNRNHGTHIYRGWRLAQ